MLAEGEAVAVLTSVVAKDAGFALVAMPADAASVQTGLERALKSLPMQRLGLEDLGRAEVLLAEICNNIIEHAYAGGGGEIRLLIRWEAARLCFVIEDEGCELPGGCLPAGRLPDPKLLPEGGFGWFLIRAMASEITYLRKGKTNRLDVTLACEQ